MNVPEPFPFAKRACSLSHFWKVIEGNQKGWDETQDAAGFKCTIVEVFTHTRHSFNSLLQGKRCSDHNAPLYQCRVQCQK